MAGEAKTNQFMLGTATVMVGPQADLFSLNPDEHSIGLVKNFTLTSEPGFTDLTQGVKNTVVYSVMTANKVRANMEAYEYTAKNLAYAAALDGSTITPADVATTLQTEVVANPVGSDTLELASVTGLVVNDWLHVQEGSDDRVTMGRISAIDSTAKSVTLAQSFKHAIPAGAKVTKVNAIGVGSKKDQPYLAAKVVGKLADGSVVSLLIPKLRVTNGFAVAFKTDSFGNLPLQFDVQDLTASEPFYAEFADKGSAILLTE
ncbi:hypothetical protein [Cupriavidus sp. RAF12]|uniref:hypothetical protein n=1 Tax=Cupriavidus sp. RAF12 TaxID=3233050 RepID=UPI003F90314E